MATSRASRASSSRPYEVLFQMVIGKWISQALGTVVEIGVPEQLAKGARRCSDIAREAGVRSEEHTSELQSRQYLVCRLLLEKKKKKEIVSHIAFKIQVAVRAPVEAVQLIHI